jgi:hypothetical protein
MPDTAQLNVFISYGRKDASTFVDKLAADLVARGFQVWRDTANLTSPHPWDDQIVAALERSDVVVAVLTPHAVRAAKNVPLTDESVCLDELAYARFSQPPTSIVPILLKRCDPPFVIYRLNYLDFLDSEADEARYTANLDRLIATLRALKAGQLPAYRRAHFEPLDFDLYLASKTRDFVGREWLQADLAQYLAQAGDAPAALLLVGDPGWGKTAFAAQLFRGNPDGRLLAAHFCRADRSDTIDADRFVKSLVAMVAMRSPDFAKHLEEALAREDVLDSVRVRFEKLFLETLSKLDTSSLVPLPRYILVDGLDEAEKRDASIPGLIAQTLPMFPPWLRIVATSRSRPEILAAFAAATIWRLDNADPRNRRDVRAIVDHAIGLDVDPTSPHRDLADAVDAKAQGNALCATHLVISVRRDGLDPRTLAALPGGLTAIYLEILKRRFDREGPEWRAAREILEMILATPAPLPIRLVALARSDTSEYNTRAAVDRLADLLQIHDDAVRLFHQTFAAFLVDRRNPFFVESRGGAERLADFAVAEESVRLDVKLRHVCDQCLRAWIVGSSDPGRYEGVLRRAYEPVFEQDFEVHATAGKGDLAEDLALLYAFIAAHRVDGLLDVIDLAMETAKRRNPGMPPAYTGGTLQDIPEGAEWLRYRKGIDAGIWLNQFALIWIEEIVARAPETKPRLLEMWKRHQNFFTFYDFLTTQYRSYGISGWYGDEAMTLYEESRRIAGLLNK